MKTLRQNMKMCTSCHLSPGNPKSKVTQVVPSNGPISSLMLVGEAPGGNEDEEGKPFVGQAGKMLNRLLQEAGIKREQTYITNIVKCRPFNEKATGRLSNRPPTWAEIRACKGWLWREIQLVQPKAIVMLGKLPTRLLLKIEEKRFSMKTYLRLGFKSAWNGEDTLLYPCWHPSYLMRKGEEEFQEAVECLKMAKKRCLEH